ncbi:MAG: hypothetical protein JXR39_13510 [Marinilabiliaceae bacterium]|nr:hypothetical protein [Marinilabiliaceae bacterium]
MEFILQLLADMFPGFEEETPTNISPILEEEATEVGSLLNTPEAEQANIFNFIEFH